MSNEIVSHEEVLNTLVAEFHGVATAQALADSLSVSVATVRRRCADLAASGWVQPRKNRTMNRRLGIGSMKTNGFTVTPRGREAAQSLEAW